MKKLLFFGDSHCGHELGLTHPHWWTERTKKYQERFWNGYLEILKNIGKIDLAVGMGDLIDGPGVKGDTTHHVETDLNEQVNMAIKAVEEIQTDKLIFVRGTGVHVDNGLCVEDLIARYFGAPIYDHKVFKVGDKLFDVSHKVSRSGTPYGKSTGLARTIINSELYDKKPADYFFRGHVHYHVGAVIRSKKAFSTLALQLCGPTNSKFTRGLERSQYDVGLLEVVCYNDGGIRAIPHYIDNGGN